MVCLPHLCLSADVAEPLREAGASTVLVAHRLRERSRFGDLVTGYPWNPLRTEVVVPTAVQDPSVATR